MPAPTAAVVWGDYNIPGVPSSGNKWPKKAEARAWGAWLESFITGIGASGGSIYLTRASLFADLSHPANDMAWVIQDPTIAYNGVYRKVGSIGSGNWTRVADLPYSFIEANNSGAGTANAIQADSSIPVSDSALVLLNIVATNTVSPVTVAFNGGAVLTIKSNSGNDIAVGGLPSGMLVMGRLDGSTFRLVSDQVSGAIVAAAEAAQAAAEAARDDAEAAAAALLFRLYATVAEAEAATIPNTAAYIAIVETDSGVLYFSRETSDPGTGNRFQSADGAWWVAVSVPTSLDQIIRAWKITSVRNRVHMGGHSNAYDNSNSISGGYSVNGAGRTFVHGAVARASWQDGYIRQVKVHVPANGGDAGNGIKLKILRANGSSYDVIATSPLIPVGAGTGLKTINIAAFGPFNMGDFVGFFMTGGTSTKSWTIGTNAANSIKYIIGDAVGGEVYTTEANADPCFEALGAPAFVTTDGDSLMEGHNLGTGNMWHSPADVGPTGNRNADPFYKALPSLPGVNYENVAVGGSTWANLVSRQTTWVTRAKSHSVVIMCGVNDIVNGRTWAQVEADMNTYLATLDAGTRLFLCEMIPYPGTDAQAATIRDWNARYATWCDNNGAFLIPAWAAMGQLRVSTGFNDTLIAAYNIGDGHLTTAGVNALAGLIADGFLAKIV
ncbi:SGNH/GDSL hydrolase family protein [Rhizobium ruizarguesonis]|uniref:SGNH hydrolase-type esterase domain-containing protein n=2 Tax=Rhizobium TaxID=379 RepID=A0A179C294_RHILE|nr:SGNH/GDSL hydrolase family protein [Rhizobium leguminosarum]OAP97698.1 hypothetical protein A4U53_36205 [Rhizobium leguminosarum]